MENEENCWSMKFVNYTASKRPLMASEATDCRHLIRADLGGDSIAFFCRRMYRPMYCRKYRPNFSSAAYKMGTSYRYPFQNWLWRRFWRYIGRYIRRRKNSIESPPCGVGMAGLYFCCGSPRLSSHRLMMMERWVRGKDVKVDVGSTPSFIFPTCCYLHSSSPQAGRASVYEWSMMEDPAVAKRGEVNSIHSSIRPTCPIGVREWRRGRMLKSGRRFHTIIFFRHVVTSPPPPPERRVFMNQEWWRIRKERGGEFNPLKY